MNVLIKFHLNVFQKKLIFKTNKKLKADDKRSPMTGLSGKVFSGVDGTSGANSTAKSLS